MAKVLFVGLGVGALYFFWQAIIFVAVVFLGGGN
jgi:hypothetical protein